jgi:hypothetical protein
MAVSAPVPAMRCSDSPRFRCAGGPWRCVRGRSPLPFSQPLGVERPAFGVGVHVEVVLAERRQLGQFLCDRKLQVMARDTFVVSNCLDVQQQAFLGRVFVDVDPPRSRTIAGADRVIGRNPVGTAERSMGTTASLFFGRRQNSCGSLSYIWSRYWCKDPGACVAGTQHWTAMHKKNLSAVKL